MISRLAWSPLFMLNFISQQIFKSESLAVSFHEISKAVLIIKKYLNSSFPTRSQIWNTEIDNICGFKMRQQRLKICRFLYLPQSFASADQTENYDWNDLVAYGEKFTGITACAFEKHWKSPSSWKEESSAHITLRALNVKSNIEEKYILQQHF